jgi:lysyl-tRNA synthetase class I
LIVQNLFEQYLKNEIISSPDKDSIDEHHVQAFKEDFQNFLRKVLVDIDIIDQTVLLHDIFAPLIDSNLQTKLEKKVKLMHTKEVSFFFKDLQTLVFP